MTERGERGFGGRSARSMERVVGMFGSFRRGRMTSAIRGARVGGTQETADRGLGEGPGSYKVPAQLISDVDGNAKGWKRKGREQGPIHLVSQHLEMMRGSGLTARKMFLRGDSVILG